MRKIFYLFALVLLFCSCDKSIDLNVMSFNVRYDNPEDSLNNWQYRKDVAAQIIKDANIDVVDTQEVLINQLNDLKASLPEYIAIGVGRLDGKEDGEHSAIFYKKDRFTEIESGNFWLSETPEEPGLVGWDAACERIATWVILEEIKSKKQFLFINTHLDHVGEIARQEGVTLLLNRTAEYRKELPVIMTGDFNATPESDVIKHILDETNPNHLIHTKDIAETTTGLEGTFHDFGKIPVKERAFIDYIFVSPTVKVKSHSVIPEKSNDVYISDHSPVGALITL